MILFSIILENNSRANNDGRASLKEVTRIAQLAADNTVSIGASLSHVHVPGRREPEEDELKDGVTEIGMGIHNEAGSERKSVDLPELVKTMLSHCLDTADQDRSFSKITQNDEVVLLVNNKIKPVRTLSGTFMTSLNGLGFSISLLRVADTGSSTSMLQLLDAPAEASGWSAAVTSSTWAKRNDAEKEVAEADTEEIKPSNLRGRMVKP